MKKIIGIAIIIALLVMVLVPVTVGAETDSLVMDWGYVWLALAAWCGAIISALLGWGDSKKPFDSHKFFSSVLRAFLAALIAAVTYVWVGAITVPILFGAVLAGSGIDVLGNRIAGITVSPKATSPPKV